MTANTSNAVPAPIFVDVLADNPHKVEIEKIYKAGITSGCAFIND
jgi:hypothetical protein